MEPGHFYLLGAGCVIVAITGVSVLGGWIFLLLTIGVLLFAIGRIVEEAPVVEAGLKGDDLDKSWGYTKRCKYCDFTTTYSGQESPQKQMDRHVADSHGHGLHYLDMVSKSKKK